MAGLVVTKTGTGGITINIPLQFETIDHLAKVIIDDLTAGAGSGPNPHQDAIQLPATLKTLTDMVSGDFSALPAAIDEATQTLMDTSQAAIQDISNAAGMHAMVQECQENLDGTLIAAMKKLEEVAGAADFAAFQTAAGAAATFPNTDLGGVAQAAANLQQFTALTDNMNTQGSVGTAISQLNDIAKNAGTLGAAGALATAVASDIGLTAPPVINDAFAELQDGAAFTGARTIAEGMKAVKNVIDMGTYSGHLDDIIDVAYQLPAVQRTAASGTYANQVVMSISIDNVPGRPPHNRVPTDGEPGFVNVPGWINPNTNALEYIPAGSLQENLGQIQTDLLAKASSIQAKVVASLAPIEELTSAIGLAVSSGNLPAALDSALSGAVKTAMAAAKTDVAANPHVDPPAPAGAPPEDGGDGRPK